MNARWKPTLALLAALVLAGCGKPAPEKSPAEAEGTPPSGEGAVYEEGKGLSLSDESRRTIGVTFATVERKPLRAGITVTAQVYRAAAEQPNRFGREKAGSAYATVWVDPAALPAKAGQRIRADLSGAAGDGIDGTVWRIADASLPATGKEELLLEIPDPAERLAVGDFLPVRIDPDGTPQPVLKVPRSAVLHAAAGTSAYLDRDGWLLRVPVTVGREADGAAEIASGLAEGDKVVSGGVDSLYLIELRFTKGGGDAD